MPFSSGRSVRAPASKATRIVVARVPGERDAVERQAVGGRWRRSICGIANDDSDRCKRPCRQRRTGRERGRMPLTSQAMADDRTPARVARAAMPAAGRSTRGPSVIEFRGVSKTYESATSASTTPRSRSRRGEFVFLVGSTGSGKSTIMRLLIKELEPTAGTIRVAGRDLARDRRAAKVPYYRRNLGVVFQDFKLLPNRTVHDNVAYALQVTGGARKEIRAKVPDILRLTGLSTEAPQLPRPALRRRAAARLDRARVRQPPAAAAGRRADRQPRPRDVDRDHAAALPHQPHGHDRRSSPRTTRAMVDRMRRRVIELERRPHRPRRGRRPLRAARPDDRRVRRAAARRAGARARTTCAPASAGDDVRRAPSDD